MMMAVSQSVSQTQREEFSGSCKVKKSSTFAYFCHHAVLAAKPNYSNVKLCAIFGQNLRVPETFGSQIFKPKVYEDIKSGHTFGRRTVRYIVLFRNLIRKRRLYG
jgi:hypothetical protein